MIVLVEPVEIVDVMNGPEYPQPFTVDAIVTSTAPPGYNFLHFAQNWHRHDCGLSHAYFIEHDGEITNVWPCVAPSADDLPNLLELAWRLFPGDNQGSLF